MTQSELAKKIGEHQSNVSAHENGARWKPELISTYADALGLSDEDVMVALTGRRKPSARKVGKKASRVKKKEAGPPRPDAQPPQPVRRATPER